MTAEPVVFSHRDDDRITLAVNLPVPPTRAWRALTETDQLQAWWGDHVRLDARPGGRFVERWADPGGSSITTSGTVGRAEPPRLLELSWADEGWGVTTQVRFELEERDDGCRLALDHWGWGGFPDGEREELMEDHAAGWTAHLEKLARYLGAGDGAA